jgi:benzoyl-CoA 2,3-dioxygenase component A
MGYIRQHLIDPEICIRCNTCEETCPVDAVTHNDDNYVVDAAICEACMDCIAPCPTGAIDNWRMVAVPYSLDDQFGWDELPAQDEVAASAGGQGEAIDEDVSALMSIAHSGQGGRVVPPPSASKPTVNLFRRTKPATAKVVGNFRITDEAAETDTRHIVLDFGATVFPVLEGQCIGIVPPGTDAEGKPHEVRLYSVASPRDGERPNHNNLALTVKREVMVADGETHRGVASNYLCDLERGEEVAVTGPFGATFLMPDDPDANIIMICTGTGSAPFRAFTERRRRTAPSARGRLMLFFGARRPEELPYFGPLAKVPASILDQELVFSRLEGRPKEYVQDRMRARSDDIAALLDSDRTHVYVCGLKGMEEGVFAALADICTAHDLDWPGLSGLMRAQGRYHVETY